MPLSEYVLKIIANAFEGSWVGLLTADGEVTAPEYSRQPVVWRFTFDDGGLVARNKFGVGFDAAKSPWGTLTALAVYDQETGGNELRTTALEEAREVDAGCVTFPPRSMEFSIKNAK